MKTDLFKEDRSETESRKSRSYQRLDRSSFVDMGSNYELEKSLAKSARIKPGFGIKEKEPDQLLVPQRECHCAIC